MRRREFIRVVGGAVAWPISARAQRPERKRLIGLLMGFADSDPNAQALVTAFREALTERGWVEGGNLSIELRWSASNPDMMRTFAKELVHLTPDIIVGQTTPVLRALAHETQTIPIVFTVVSDPVGGGFAGDLAHPGGHITGFTDVQASMGGKYLNLLKEIAPHTQRVALLFNPTTAPPLAFYIDAIRAAATSFSIEAVVTPVHHKDEIETVIAERRGQGGAIIVMPDTFNTTNRELIIGLAARYGVPAIYFNRYFAASGGLIAYGADYVELFRQAAGYVDQILHGANPGELPIQLPAKFDLVINLRTANALGIKVPQTLLSFANELIE